MRNKNSGFPIDGSKVPNQWQAATLPQTEHCVVHGNDVCVRCFKEGNTCAQIFVNDLE
jgi:hypothetical protein